jgi:hypothetical protein
LLSVPGDCSVHEIDFGLPLGQNILQHAGAMLARCVCAFFYKFPRIAMQFNTKLARDGFSFCNQIIEKLRGGFEPAACAMMQQRQRSNGVRRRIED